MTSGDTARLRDESDDPASSTRTMDSGAVAERKVSGCARLAN